MSPEGFKISPITRDEAIGILNTVEEDTLRVYANGASRDGENAGSKEKCIELILEYIAVEEARAKNLAGYHRFKDETKRQLFNSLFEKPKRNERRNLKREEDYKKWLKTQCTRKQIEFTTKMFLYYYTNLGEIKDDGSPNLLLDLMQRYDIESQTVHLVMSTINTRSYNL